MKRGWRIYIFLCFLMLSFMGSHKFFYVYNLASKSIFNKVTEKDNPYNREEFVSRKYSALNSVYRLEGDIRARSGHQEILLIGVGRGYAALEMALKHPNIHITAVNKEHSLFDLSKIADFFRETHSDNAVAEALSRIHLKIMNIEEIDGLGKKHFDVIVFETKVMMYLKDKLKTVEELFNRYLNSDGALFFDGSYIYSEPEKGETRISGRPPKELFLELQLELFNKGHKFVDFIRNDYVLDPTFKMVKYGQGEIAFPFALDESFTEMETAYHREKRSLIVDRDFAPYLSVYDKVKRLVAVSS